MTCVLSVQNLLMPSNIRPGLDRCSIMSPATTTSNFRVDLQFVQPFDISSDNVGEYSELPVFVDDRNAAINPDGLRQLGEFPMQALLS